MNAASGERVRQHEERADDVDGRVWFEPGSAAYAAATRPANSSVQQRPAFVVRPRTSADVVTAVREAARRGLRVVPQATGHGAGATVDAGVVLLDTSGLDSLTIDPAIRAARAGAGLTWGRVNAAAERHGLLGLSGSAPTVAICGYTFGGGAGWLTRPHGLAAAGLRHVEYVTGRGEVRHASEDAADVVDRDALWAFRGGGGVGIATELEFDLVPVVDLHAGYLLWPADALDSLVAAWGASLPAVSADTATSLSVLHLPDAPTFPAALRGRSAVHLAIASAAGSAGAEPFLTAVRAAARPEVDTWGPADAARLARIHLDPPGPVPALGYGRWLTAGAPALAAQLLHLAALDGSPLVLVEIRNLDGEPSTTVGAATSVPGPFVLHVVGPLRPGARPAIAAAFDRIEAMIATIDTGRTAAPWMDGSASTPDALPSHVRARVDRIADTVDPDRVLARSRYLG